MKGKEDSSSDLRNVPTTEHTEPRIDHTLVIKGTRFLWSEESHELYTVRGITVKKRTVPRSIVYKGDYLRRMEEMD